MQSGIPQTGDSATRENVLHIAKGAEREGLNSVWVFERLLWPLKPKTAYGHAFSPIGKDMKNMIEMTKQLARFAK